MYVHSSLTRYFSPTIKNNLYGEDTMWIEKQNSIICNSKDSRARLPGFKSQIHLLAVWPWTPYFTQTSFPCKMGINHSSVYFVGVLWELNELIYVKPFEYCLTIVRAISYCTIIWEVGYFKENMRILALYTTTLTLLYFPIFSSAPMF